MAVAMRATVAKPASLRRLFSTPSSIHPPGPEPTWREPPEEPPTRLIVSGIRSTTTTEGLRDAFAKFGRVTNARIVVNRAGASLGFGYVYYATTEEAAAGIKGMDGSVLDKRIIYVEFSKVIPPPSFAERQNMLQVGRMFYNPPGKK